jgi:hypothetical protein
LRRIPLSRRSHVIGFQPLSTGTAEHESALERDFVTVSSFLDPAASIISQPVTISFQDGDVMRRYTPDYLVKRTSGLAELTEVKYRMDLHAQWPRLRPAFAAARRWAEEHEAVFRIATERRIRGALLENAKRLLPLRRAPVDLKIVDAIVLVVHSQRELSLGALLDGLSVSRRAGLATIWRLLARRALYADLHSKITLDTRVSLP